MLRQSEAKLIFIKIMSLARFSDIASSPAIFSILSKGKIGLTLNAPSSNNIVSTVHFPTALVIRMKISLYVAEFRLSENTQIFRQESDR